MSFSCHADRLAGHFPSRAKPTPSRIADARPARPMEPFMSTAFRQASNAILTAARLYKEFAQSASELLHPGTYLNRLH